MKKPHVVTYEIYVECLVYAESDEQAVSLANAEFDKKPELSTIDITSTPIRDPSFIKHLRENAQIVIEVQP